jgi:hypothetical protein
MYAKPLASLAKWCEYINFRHQFEVYPPWKNKLNKRLIHRFTRINHINELAGCTCTKNISFQNISNYINLIEFFDRVPP